MNDGFLSTSERIEKIVDDATRINESIIQLIKTVEENYETVKKFNEDIVSKKKQVLGLVSGVYS